MIIWLVAFVLGGLFWGWIIMLLAGMLWHEFGIGTPIGMFPASFGFGVLFSVVMTALGAVSSSYDD